jgi:stage II sporulation protein D
MKRFLVLVLGIFILNDSFSTDIKIGILSDQNVKSFLIIPIVGSYSLTNNENSICDLTIQNSMEILAVGNTIQLKHNGKILGNYPKLFLKGKSERNHFKLKSNHPTLNSLTYYDDLGISSINGAFHLINVVDIENYVRGVIECEAGSKQNMEYYKLQAIICRTYALGNLRKHEMDGFNLCDKVHCQVYKGVSQANENINKAVKETVEMVVVDKNLNIIHATFHSNCGGETANPENVWSMPVSYLKSKKDTFCNQQPHAKWQKSIKLNDWKNYLAKYNIVVQATDKSNALCFLQNDREIYYSYSNQKIPLKNIRDDWNLRSTYFNIEQKKDSIVFIGRGFGHGVGLCQEGSMKMADIGYIYLDILNFYYTDIYLMDLDALNFFKDSSLPEGRNGLKKESN